MEEGGSPSRSLRGMGLAWSEDGQAAGRLLAAHHVAASRPLCPHVFVFVSGVQVVGWDAGVWCCVRFCHSLGGSLLLQRPWAQV